MKTKNIKGQYSVLEYVFLSLFIIAIIIGLMFFLTIWSSIQFGAESMKTEWDRALWLGQYVQNIPLLVKETGMFDDGKLTALASMGPSKACEYLESLAGPDFFMELRILDGNETQINCTWQNYPDCNYWEFCKNTGKKKKKFYTLPVNVYRRIGFKLQETTTGRTDIGILKAGVY